MTCRKAHASAFNPFVIFRRDQVHGILDGIVYAALVGIGFAFVEDIFYYLGALNSDLVSVFLVRARLRM